MSTQKQILQEGSTPVRDRASRATKIGTVALVIAPLGALVGGAAYLGAGGAASDPAVMLDEVVAKPTLWAVYSVAMLVMALSTLAWAPAVWRVSHDHSPRWAWAATIVGTLYAAGQFVHLMSWNVMIPALAGSLPAADAIAVVEAAETQWFFYLIFIPYLAGALVAPLIAAIALFRARMLPLWSLILVGVASVVLAILGTDNLITLAVGSVGMIVGFMPAVVRVLRR